ncbi:MAG: GNAT family protein [Acidimicrobiales bacterium]
MNDDAQTLAAANLRSGGIGIRHVRPADYEWIFESLWLSSGNLMNYRLAGVVPAPEQLIDTLWRGVDGQFLIVEEGSRGEVRHGLVTFYERDDRAGTCGLAVALAESSQGAGRPLVGIGLAIDHWFRVTPARKIWVEVPGWNISRLRGISAFGFELEGCRREQDWLDGRHWDRHLYALFKSNWSAVRPLLHLVDRNRHPG